jgi:hypothetical protein
MTVAKQTDNEVWCRGYGEDQYVDYARRGPKQFLGGTVQVKSYRDLERYLIAQPSVCERKPTDCGQSKRVTGGR